MNKIHLLAFTSALGGGGAEMHLTRLLNHLDRRRFDLSLALARSGGSYEANLAQDVARVTMATGRSRSSTLRLLRSVIPLRRAMQSLRPDVVFSVMDHANVVAMLAAMGLPRPPKLVLGVQNTLSATYWRDRDPTSRIVKALIPRLYPRADRIVALSHGVADDMLRLLPRLRGSIEIIANAGVDESVLQQVAEPLSDAEQPQQRPLILACGRLTEQKGFPYLIEAFARVRRTTPAQLWILGEGEQRRALESQIAQAGLRGHVRLLGFQRNPFKFMAAADVFVLSSLWEGFGNVIVEAMACGAAVVSTDCPYGPAEIIIDGKSGLLVQPADASALAAALQRVLGDPALRQALAHNGRLRSQEFRAHTIAAAYGDLLLRIG